MERDREQRRAYVHSLVDIEMNRTDENIDDPSEDDYLADIARWFNRLVWDDED